MLVVLGPVLFKTTVDVYVSVPFVHKIGRRLVPDSVVVGVGMDAEAVMRLVPESPVNDAWMALGIQVSMMHVYIVGQRVVKES